MGIIEECVLIDGDKLSQVIIPMMNVSRKVKGKTDPNEIHKRQLYVNIFILIFIIKFIKNKNMRHYIVIYKCELLKLRGTP